MRIDKEIDGLRESIIDLAESEPTILHELGGDRLTSLDKKAIKKIIYGMGASALLDLSKTTGNIIPPMI